MLSLERIADFFYAHPSGFSHLIDLPYRLSSWSLDNPENIHVWESGGQIQAIGIIQMPWSSLDYVYQPAAEDMVPAIVDWAIQRSTAIAQEKGGDFTLCVRISPARAAHISLVEDRAYQLNDEWTIVHLSRTLTATLSVPDLPDGFSFRALRGPSEVEAYVNLHQTAFGSKAMQVGWRARTLEMSQYHPALDLFIVNANDQPIAFSIGWLHPTESRGQIEPLGVHPDYQRLGLGRAVLLEGLRRLQVHGANVLSIDTYKFNDPAFTLYQTPENGNFEPHYEATGYVREFTA